VNDWTFLPLTPARWDDFVTLFSEHGVQNGCWCTYWRLTRQQYHRQYYGGKSKQLMHSIVDSGSVPGLLAYCESIPAAWISIAPRHEFPSLDRSAMLKSVDERPVWSIVCFFIAKAYRGKGISSMLVAAAINYARQNGVQIVEAYPFNTTSRACLLPERYMGVLSTFQKAGFRLAADRGGQRLVVRLDTHSSALPNLHQLLPVLGHFVQGLAWEYQCDRLSAEDLHRAIVEFYSPREMTNIEKIIPGWNEMATYASGQTLIHITCMLLAMLASPEYAQASDDDKLLLEWIAVLHDLGKQATERQRDHAHAFRSAAKAAYILPRLGFPVSDRYTQVIDGWAERASRAVIVKEEAVIQDNTYLADILDGIDVMFGARSPAARLIQCILLHMSLDTVPDEWPCPAGLDNELAQRWIDQDLLSLLTAVMLADSDAWNLYNLPTKERYRRMTLNYIRRIWPVFVIARET
jgi:GNAT superfamily N-acetyltransferase